jgi:hypothetical protein
MMYPTNATPALVVDPLTKARHDLDLCRSNLECAAQQFTDALHAVRIAEITTEAVRDRLTANDPN